MATEALKRVFYSGIKWLNIAFAGYEISELTSDKDSTKINELNFEAKINELNKIHEQVKNISNNSSNHVIIVIAFLVILCLLYALLFALKVFIRAQKRKVLGQLKTTTNDVSSSV